MKLYTLREAADKLKIHRNTVADLVRCWRIPTHSIEEHYRGRARGLTSAAVNLMAERLKPRKRETDGARTDTDG